MTQLANIFTAGLGIGVGVFFLFILIFCVALPLVIGILVYRDARNQAISAPLLWAILAALAPSFIGLIVYLVVRCTSGKGA